MRAVGLTLIAESTGARTIPGKIDIFQSKGVSRDIPTVRAECCRSRANRVAERNKRLRSGQLRHGADRSREGLYLTQFTIRPVEFLAYPHESGQPAPPPSINSAAGYR